MKFACFLFLVALAAFASAAPFGTCPKVDGVKPVYLMNLKNRNVYYECSNGVPRPVSCSGDLVFNPKENICDYPSATCDAFGPVGECTESYDNFPVYLRDGCNVGVFYVCDSGAPRGLRCADGLVYDPYRETCYRQGV